MSGIPEGKVKVLKLANCEDIIGSVAVEGNVVLVSRPLRLLVQYNPKSESHEIILVRWLPFSTDERIAIPTHQIITVVAPSCEFEEHYLQTLLEHESDESGEPSEDYWHDLLVNAETDGKVH